MESRLAFTILLLVILVIIVAHIFACERAEGVEGAMLGSDIMRYVVPVAFE
jgi:hypothetical protein